MKEKDNVNIIIDQQCSNSSKQVKATAYYAEILKDLKASKDINPVEKPEEKKVYDLNKLKEKKLLSVDEAAELFGIGRNKIRKISDSDDCPFVLWIGSHRKIKREAFEKFLNDIQSA